MALARLVREEAGGTGLFALYHPTTDSKLVELSCAFIRAPIVGLPQGQLASDPTGGQIWRNQAAASKDAEGQFEAPYEFAIKSRVEAVPKPLPGDMGYVQCAIAEVIEAASADGKLVVKLATEQTQVPGRTLYRTYYRFLHDAKTMKVAANSVIFPLDLTFTASLGHFALQKNKQQKTV